jgi:hypothetical protein
VNRAAIEPRLSWAGSRLVAITAANAGDAVYGALMIGVLLAADDARRVGYPATLEGAVVVLALYWLTSLYAHSVGLRVRSREPLNAALVWRSCVHELPVVEGGVIPVVTLLVAWAAGVTVASGVTAALWAAAVVVVLLEIVAGVRARGRKRLWLEALAGAAMGLALIALQLILH